MKKAIVVAGFTRLEYLEILREHFPEYEVGIVRGREINSEGKRNLINKADFSVTLTQPDFLEIMNKRQVEAITFTQERDLRTYLDTLLALNFCTPEEHALYATATNKSEMKHFLREQGMHCVPELYSPTSVPEDAFPVVLKPLGFTGSVGVTLVRSARELQERLERVSFLRATDFIAEEYLEGAQYSLNIYVNKDGVVTFCPPTEVVGGFERGLRSAHSVLQITPAPLDHALLSSLHQLIEELVRVFAIKNTSAHFDLVLSKGEWKVFEIGLRIGGLRQEIFQESYGFNHFKNDISNRLGRKVVVPEQAKNVVVVVQIAAETKGRLQSFPLPSALHEMESKVVVDKDTAIGIDVAPISEGGTTLRRYLVSHPSLETARADAERLLQETEVIIEK